MHITNINNKTMWWSFKLHSTNSTPLIQNPKTSDLSHISLGASNPIDFEVPFVISVRDSEISWVKDYSVKSEYNTLISDSKMVTLFVGDIPSSSSQDDLMELFSYCGTVIKIKLVTRRALISCGDTTGVSEQMSFESATPSHLGYGFVEMEDPNAALFAIKHINGRLFQGRYLRVNWRSYGKDPNSKGSVLAGNSPANSIHVRFRRLPVSLFFNIKIYRSIVLITWWRVTFLVVHFRNLLQQ